MSSCIAGIFVGGRSSRMRGTPKGLLQPPEQTRGLVERLIERLAAVAVCDVVLVGRQPAYDQLDLPVVADAPVGEGPMAGLLGLVEHAAERGAEFVLALACDMPNVDAPLLQRLLREEPDADALVPRREHWEPLCARYRVNAVRSHLARLLGAKQYRMMSLLEALGTRCSVLRLTTAERAALVDWDSPSDLPDGVSCLGRPVARD